MAHDKTRNFEAECAAQEDATDCPLCKLGFKPKLMRQVAEVDTDGKPTGRYVMIEQKYITALATLQTHMAAGAWHKALALASGWHRLGEHKVAIQQAHAAHMNPNLYKQLGKDPVALVAAGVAALQARYGEQRRNK